METMFREKIPSKVPAKTNNIDIFKNCFMKYFDYKIPEVEVSYSWKRRLIRTFHIRSSPQFLHFLPTAVRSKTRIIWQ